ncbi:MAG: hypothetical protein JW783_09230 [Bacteroidales bacterium]|nr:hypothetical protein [Bacteroidales bacterium]MBN2749748.1 hypothetical protein [Bacteroidales bacterium]HPX05155.1 hypothetical protein [Tenuifilaceae bacterium]HQB78395.1 hypothetical protein [Tenuifilaceae bacterium]
MEIEFKTKTFKNIFVPWAGVFLGVFSLYFIGYMLIVFLFNTKTFSILSFLEDGWIHLTFNALVLSGVIAFQFSISKITVKHNGEIDHELVKQYFISHRYVMYKVKENKTYFKPQKLWERFLSNRYYVTIIENENEITTYLPSRLLYDFHHAFKFGNLFLKKG